MVGQRKVLLSVFEAAVKDSAQLIPDGISRARDT
jgi:hypothetical protein